MISIYFEDGRGTRLGAALFGAMPQPGDTVSLRLTAGVLRQDGTSLPWLDARFLVQSIHPHWVAFNHDPLLDWMSAYRSDKEAYAIVDVLAKDEETQRYIDSVRENNRIKKANE